MAKKLPLEGIRVIDLTVVWAGPFATMFMADWGAEVIRVESINHFQSLTRGSMAHPPKEMIANQTPWSGGYPDRDPGERPYNRFPWFNYHARNKLSMTVDMIRPEGMDVFRRLVEVSDVVIENNAPEVMDSLGVTYEKLKEWKPDIIMLRMPGYGLWGPYGNFRALGAHMEAAAGHTWLRGYPDAGPSLTPTVYHGDNVSGVHGAFAAVAALRQRRRTGKGQFIELAQTESIMPQLGEAIMDYILNKRVQGTIGNRDASAAPCGCYRAAGEDRWVNITVRNDKDWEGFCAASGHPDWTKDDRFSDGLSRYQNQDALDQYVEAWTSQHQNYEIMHLLQEHGVPAGPTIDQRDAFADPHIKDRGFFQELTHPEAGTHQYPGIMWRASETPNHIRRAACCLGQDNEYVYKKVIGVSDEEYAALEKAGHIGTEFAPGIR